MGGESADETDSFTYVASDGVLESAPATVRIAIRTPNSGPHIISTPVTAAADGVSYAYAAQASDPDAGDILTFSLPAAPAGMSIDPASGLIAWVPTAGQQGSHSVVLKVSDVRGLSALQGYQITVTAALTVPDVVGQAQAVAENAITSASMAIGAVTTRHAAGTPQGSVVSQNPVGGSAAAAGTPVSFVVSLGPPPVGTVPNVVGLAQTAAQLDVTAAGFSNTVTGQNNPLVPVGVVMTQIPAGGTIAPATTVVSLVVSLGPPPGELDLDHDGFTGNQGDCNDTDAAINPLAFDLPGDGIDQNCNGVDSIVGDGTAPVASLASPGDLATVTMPTDIVGTATDANFLRYTVTLAEADAAGATVIGSGTTAITNAVLGRLDPTLLENGMYRVRLIAEDVNGATSVAEHVYLVTGEAKVGLMALSFVDLHVPVSGIPITVVRSYDNRVKTQRDFGIGWSLEVKTGKYRHNRPPGDGWTVTTAPGPLGVPCMVVGEPRSHLTEVRLSDREFYVFRTTLTDLAPLVGGCVGTAGFEYVDGTLPEATLEVLGNTDILYTSGDVVTEFDGDGNTGLTYNPARLRLTTVDGRRYDFDRSGLTHLEDPNGNALNITPAGISHSSGKSIAFERDQLGRITRIIDPLGFSTTYGYDAHGDLVVFEDQASNQSTFAYDATHNLTDIHDPLGNRAFAGEYDSAGRLIAMVDARGNRIEYTHDLGARTDVVIDAAGNITRLVFDELGFVTSQEREVTINGAPTMATATFVNDTFGNQTVTVDPDGMRIESVYDHDRLLEDVVDPAGLQLRTTQSYDTRGEVLTKTDAGGNQTGFDYDRRGNLSRYVDPVGSAWNLTYDTQGHPTVGRDALGVETRLSYDSAGHVLSEERVDSGGSVLRRMDFTYDANGNRVSMTELRTIRGIQRQLTTQYAYDGKNRLVVTTDPLGGVSQIEYNALGKERARIDALGRRTEFAYDEVGALIRTTLPDGAFVTQAYDARGNVISKTDQRGQVTHLEYDELNRQVKVISPNGTFTQAVYSPGGRITARIDAAGNRTDYDYDDAGRLVSTIQPEAFDVALGASHRPRTNQEHDGLGRPTAVVDANGRRTTMVYEGFDRLLRRVNPDGTMREQRYDSLGRKIEQLDEAGRSTQFGYDLLGRLTQVIQPLASTASYAYDQAGNVLAHTDGLGRVTRSVYDELGRLVEREVPGGAREFVAYDAVGNATSHTDFNGATTISTYDAMNRLQRKMFPDGSSVAFTYTPTGLRATATDLRGTTRYEYDANDRPLRTVQPDGATVDYSYDVGGRLGMLAAPGGTQAYAYDPLNRLTTVTSLSGIASYAYDAVGNVGRVIAPNGVVSSVTYDARNRQTRVAHTRNGLTLASFDYGYSATGKRTTVADADGSTETYGYDALDRLANEVTTGVAARSIQHEYDVVGNRTRMVRHGVQTDYTYDTNDQLLTAGGVTYGYDANGNQTSRTAGGVTTSRTWDFENRLTSATSIAGSTQFQYDADGNQVARNTANGNLRLLVDSYNPTGFPQVLEERADGGQLVASHTYGLDLLAMSRGSVDRFYQYDAHGSTRQLTDGAGLVTDTYAYDGYGDVAARTGTSPNPYLFSGERLDPFTGFYDLRARQYDPSAGRFVSRDPIEGRLSDPRSRHPFAYAHGDPVNLIDPTGKFSLIELGVKAGIENVLKGLDAAVRLGTQCTFVGKAKALGAGVFLGAIAAGMAYGNETLQENIAREFGNQPPSGTVDLFGISNPAVPKEGGFKSFTWSLSYSPGRSVEQLFDFLWLQKSGLGASARLTFNMGTGNVSVGGATGYQIKGPTYSACGLDIVKTSVLAIAQQSYGQAGFGTGSFRLLGQLSLLESIAGFNYQLLSIP